MFHTLVYFTDIPISKTNLSISIVNTGVLWINATYRPKTGKIYISGFVSSNEWPLEEGLARYTRVRVPRVLMIRRANKQNALL